MKMAVKPERIKLKNGGTLVVQENHSTPQAAVSVFFKGGLRSESASNSGITNFVQRLMLKGTKKFTAFDVAKKLEFIGARLSFFTRKDLLGLRLKVLSRYLEDALHILAEVILNPSFEEGRLEKERKNILTDIKLNQDDSIAYTMELCEEMLFPEHPYRLPVLGRKESLEKIDRKKILNWYKSLYKSGNMAISAVGDLKLEKVIDLFEKMPPFQGKEKTSFPLNMEFTLSEKREIEVLRDKKQVALAIGFLSPSIRSKDFPAFEVLNHILSGMGSRLFIEVRDKKGLAYVINSQYDPRVDIGAFRIYVGCSFKQKEKAHDTILEEIEKIREEIVGQEELARAKKYLLGIRDIEMQRNSSVASLYAYYELVGLGWKMTYDFEEKIKSITAKKIKSIAERYLDTKNYAFSMLVPRKPS